MKKFKIVYAVFLFVATVAFPLWGSDKIYAGMDAISKLSDAKSRSISPENYT